jgi:tetratricopeptide (TPR) repeat protein
MKLDSLLPAALVAILCSLAVYVALPSSETTDSSGDGALASAIADLQQEVASLRRENESPRSEPAPAGYQAPARDEDLADLVAREVARYLAENSGLAAAGEEASAAAAALTDEQLLEESLRALMDPATDWDTGEEIWKQLYEAGLMEDAIALLEAEVERNPGDMDLRVELGNAYLKPILFGEAAGMDAGVWATKADAAYDAVLAIDDHHWEARFSKAVSLSFWPPIMGKQPAAISNFETLLDQQNQGPSQPHHIETYVLLGNLYQQSNQPEKATALWQQGLAQFPNDPRLIESLGLQ